MTQSVFLICKVQGLHPETGAPILSPHDSTEKPILTEEAAREWADAATLKDGQDRILLKSFMLATLKKTTEFSRTNGATILPIKGKQP